MAREGVERDVMGSAKHAPALVSEQPSRPDAMMRRGPRGMARRSWRRGGRAAATLHAMLALGCGADAASGDGGSSGSDTGAATTGTSTSGSSTSTSGANTTASAEGSTGSSSDDAAADSTGTAPDLPPEITEPSITPCGTLDPHPPGAYDIFGERYGDVWGYVDEGREYAVQASWLGVSVIDVTEEPLVEVGFVPLPGGVPGRALGGYGHHVYVGGQGGAEGTAIVYVIDVDDPTMPTIVAERPEYAGLVHTLDVFDDFLLLNSGFGHCRFLALADPAVPVEIGGYFSATDCHDALAVGDRLFVAGGYTSKWDIVDISDPGAPVLLGSTPPELGIYAHSGGLDHSGNYFLGTDEYHVKDIITYDVSDPAAPVYVSAFSLVDDAVPHNGVIEGNWFYIGYYEAGFVLLDIHDPTAPIEALRYATWPEPPMGGWNGALFVSLSLPGNKVLVADSKSGTHVLCVDVPE
jgi:hypothetical protein